MIIKVKIFKSDCTKLKYTFHINQQFGLVYGTCCVLGVYPHHFNKDIGRNKYSECLFYCFSIIFYLHTTLWSILINVLSSHSLFSPGYISSLLI